MSSLRSAHRSWLGSSRVSAVLALVVLAACAPAREPTASGELPPSHPPLVGEVGETARGASSLPPCPEDETGRIYLGLRPSCVGCHGVGTNLAFFATEASFRALLVGNPAFVTPGDAAGSVLVKLLRGTNVGAFRQMPTAGAVLTTPAGSESGIWM